MKIHVRSQQKAVVNASGRAITRLAKRAGDAVTDVAKKAATKVGKKAKDAVNKVRYRKPPPIPEIVPFNNPLFAKRKGLLKGLSEKTTGLIKNVPTIAAGVVILYAVLIHHRMYTRFQYLKENDGQPEPPFVDPVSYVMDGWPRISIQGILAKKAVDRFMKSKQFRESTQVFTPAQKKSLIERLMNRAAKSPSEEMTDAQLGQKLKAIGQLIEKEG